MDLKPVMLVEIKKEDRSYRFEMPFGAPFGECYDAAFQILNKVAELAKDAAEKMQTDASKGTAPAELN